ncbi:GspH/FimT family pseudopilin [uncultured Gilvimarinus sp.]|uniref:GspH/FimT family pseudopilin n=1 Tax=uncultured Gilvimarinus sp. TaxID=1689143 RepID=UPI0030D8F6C4
MKDRSAGFTLIELMVVVVVMTIAAAIALPNFRTMIINHQSQGLAEDVIGAIQFTRSEAVKRGEFVSLCASNADQSACGSDWSNGMLAVTDIAKENGAAVTVGEILKIWEGFSPSASISVERGSAGSLSATSFLRYAPGGMMAQISNNDTEIRFEVYVDECDGPMQRNIRVTRAGMVSAERVQCPGGGSGG